MLVNRVTGEARALIENKEELTEIISSALFLDNSTIHVVSTGSSPKHADNQVYITRWGVDGQIRGQRIEFAPKEVLPIGEQAVNPYAVLTKRGILIVNRSSNNVYTENGEWVFAYPYPGLHRGLELIKASGIHIEASLFFAQDGTVLQYARLNSNELQGKTQFVVYEPLAAAQRYHDDRAKLRYQQASRVSKAKMKAKKAYHNVKELWRTDKKKFVLYTAIAVVAVAAGAACINYAKKKKPLARAISALSGLRSAKK